MQKKITTAPEKERYLLTALSPLVVQAQVRHLSARSARPECYQGLGKILHIVKLEVSKEQKGR